MNNNTNNNQWYGQSTYNQNMQGYSQQPMYNQQYQYNQQPQYGQQPMYNQPYQNTYQAGSKTKSTKPATIIAIVSAVSIIVLFMFLIIGIKTHNKGYSQEKCRNCEKIKPCKEYYLSNYDISVAYWVCDDCYPICKNRAEEKGGSLTPKK